MSPRVRPFFFLLALVPLGLTTMCGGASSSTPPTKSPEEAARDAKSRELDELYKAEPKAPYVLDRTHAFRASRECGQGPFRADVSGLGAKYGERVDVYACSSHRIAGRVRVSADDYGDSTGDGHAFGYGDPENARCKASDAEIARVADAGAPSNAASPGRKGAHGAGAAAAKPAESEQLREDPSVALEGGKCPAGSQHEYLGSTIYDSSLTRKVHVEIWSAEPNDLRDAMFVIQQFRVDSSMTDEQWAKLRKDEDAWYARLQAFEKSHDDMFVHEDADAGFAPPPPPKAETQPPKPSVHADWVPGYYHRSGTGWAWIAGWWRVPEADVKAKLTVVAPTAPPPPRQEPVASAEPAPAPEAVWSTAHWEWDGARWVWVNGAWRLPPRQGLTWQAPRWQSEARGFVFVPGGWSVRVR